MRALRKDPARRYPSAGELAADVERYLSGRPVLARQGTLGYRTAKLFRRHRLAVATAAALSVSLVAGAAATAWQARSAQAERARAERRFADVRQLASALVFEIHDAIADMPGAAPARRLLADRAEKLLDTVAADARGDAGLLRELAFTYRRLGDVVRAQDSARARATYARGLALVDDLLARDPGDTVARAERSLYQSSLATLE